MNRLQTEFRRLYLPPSPTASATDAGASAPLVGPDGRVRALVLEISGPADWEPLAQVWRGVQTELDLPAPAIAVSGSDGLQLWFSLAEPVDLATAQAFLQALRRHYLATLPERRLRLRPLQAGGLTGAPPDDPAAIEHAGRPPALQPTTGLWSAFVAPDLAPLFSDTPWLDVAPGDDGQANLLAALVSIRPAQFDAARARLQPADATPTPTPSPGPTLPTPLPGGPAAAFDDPRDFLRAVMNDPTAPLALRIEAAKALLVAPPRPPG